MLQRSNCKYGRITVRYFVYRQMSSVPATVFAGYTRIVYQMRNLIFSKATIKQINQLAGRLLRLHLLQLD